MKFWKRLFYCALFHCCFECLIFLVDFVILLTLTSYFFLCFFASLKKVLGPNYFLPFLLRSKKIICPKSPQPRFYPLNVPISSHFNGNTICTLPSTFFMLVVCLPIGLLNFFSLWKINSKFNEQILVFLRNFYWFTKAVSIEKPPTPLYACIFTQGHFFLDTAVYSLRKRPAKNIWPILLILKNYPSPV